MTGLKAHVVHLYPRWVLSRGNDTLNCISRQPLIFAPFLLQWSLFTLRIPNHRKSLTQFGALAGQTQQMAPQKVGFTPRPIRYGSPNLHVSSSAALKSYIAELSLKPASYGTHTLGACKNRNIFGLSVPPLWVYNILSSVLV